MEYAIFFISLFVILVAGRIAPMRGWVRGMVSRPGLTLLIMASFVVPFLGGAQEAASSELGIPAGVRLARFLLLVALFIMVMPKLMQRSIAFNHAGLAAKFMLLYAMVAMFSAVYSVSPLISAWKGFEVLVLVGAGIYLAIGLRDWDDLRWLNDTLMMIMLFFVISALVGAVIAPSQVFVKHEISSAIVLKGIGPPLNPNSLTQFSALLVVMAFAYASNMGRDKGKLAVWVVISLACVAMLLGHSRTSIFAVIAAVAGVLYFGRGRLIALIVAGAGIATTLLTDVVLSYIYRGQSEELFTSMSGRTRFWEQVMEVFNQSPLIGHGFYAAQRTVLGVSSVDNTYLEVLLGLGLLGTLIFIVPIAIVAMQLLRGIPRTGQSRSEKVIWLQLMALFVLLFVRSLTGPSFQVMHPNLVMYMMLLVGTQAYHRLRSRPAQDKQVQDSVESDAAMQEKTTRILRRRPRTIHAPPS